ncbi:hypothetical protein N561_04150 [Gallibacterium anatis 12656/12]|uniref:Uncharacterized protein n=1 Tax=Gallibacterium anatis 12656/12 TaxID=1195244 RepID=U1H338_9PAST|nr:hypothetical protein N561_04150 [Gallibacterium anatis 12656/12]
MKALDNPLKINLKLSYCKKKKKKTSPNFYFYNS